MESILCWKKSKERCWGLLSISLTTVLETYLRFPRVGGRITCSPRAQTLDQLTTLPCQLVACWCRQSTERRQEEAVVVSHCTSMTSQNSFVCLIIEAEQEGVFFLFYFIFFNFLKLPNMQSWLLTVQGNHASAGWSSLEPLASSRAKEQLQSSGGLASFSTSWISFFFFHFQVTCQLTSLEATDTTWTQSEATKGFRLGSALDPQTEFCVLKSAEFPPLTDFSKFPQCCSNSVIL